VKGGPYGPYRQSERKNMLIMHSTRQLSWRKCVINIKPMKILRRSTTMACGKR
jgi:hypothetical protein